MADNERGGCCAVLLIIGALGVWHVAAGSSVEKKEAAQEAVMAGEAQAPGAIDGAIASVTPGREFDEDAATDAATDSLSGRTYEDVEGSAECTDDCGGHNAGWKWAQEQGNDCGNGESSSFDEGCQAYATAIERKVQEARDLFDKGDDAFVKSD